MRKKLVLSIFILLILGAFAIVTLNPNATGNTIINSNTCTDSDGGLNVNTPGKVSGVVYLDKETNFSQEDYCQDAHNLIEWICVPDSRNINLVPERKTYPCDSCIDGKCI